MKKLLFTLLFATTGCLFAATGGSGGRVYICTGPKSYAYHITRDCRGLSKCSAEIKSVTLEEAKSSGRKPCGWCCGK